MFEIIRFFLFYKFLIFLFWESNEWNWLRRSKSDFQSIRIQYNFIQTWFKFFFFFFEMSKKLKISSKTPQEKITLEAKVRNRFAKHWLRIKIWQNLKSVLLFFEFFFSFCGQFISSILQEMKEKALSRQCNATVQWFLMVFDTLFFKKKIAHIMNQDEDFCDKYKFLNKRNRQYNQTLPYIQSHFVGHELGSYFFDIETNCLWELHNSGFDCQILINWRQIFSKLFK